MKITGHAICFGDNINTGTIFAGRHSSRSSDLQSLVPHLFESLRPGIHTDLPGAIVVGGENFGTGSSKEHPVHMLKAAGVQAVLAKSFARSFFRNAINLGLAAVEVDTGTIVEMERLTLDLTGGVLTNETSGARLEIRPLPDIMSAILQAGGLIPYFKQHGTLSR